MRTKICLVFLIFISTLRAQDTILLQRAIDLLKQNQLRLLSEKSQQKLDVLNRKYHTYSLLPSINASTGLNSSFGRRVDPFTNTFATNNVISHSYGLSANMNLFNGFSYFNNRGILDNQIKLSRIDFVKNQNAQTLMLIENYINLCKLQIRSALIQQSIEKIKQTQKVQKKLFDAGKINSIDTLKSFISLRTEEIAVNKLNAETNAALITFNWLIGLSLETKHQFSLHSINQINDKLLLPEYFDLEKLKLESEIAIKSLSINKASTLPSLSLNGNIGTGYSSNNKDFNAVGQPTKPYDQQVNENLYQSVGIYLSIPIFSKGQYLKEKAITKVKTEQYSNEKDKLELDLHRKNLELDQKKLALKAEIVLQEDILQSFKVIYEKTLFLYQERRVSDIELEDTRTQLLEKEMILAQLKVDLQFYMIQSNK